MMGDQPGSGKQARAQSVSQPGPGCCGDFQICPFLPARPTAKATFFSSSQEIALKPNRSCGALMENYNKTVKSGLEAEHKAFFLLLSSFSPKLTRMPQISA